MEQNADDPFLQLLADDTLQVAEQAEPSEVARTSWIFGFSSAAVVSAAVLLWLALAGPGFLGYGTSLLWGGLPKRRHEAVLRRHGRSRQPHHPQARRPVDHRRSQGFTAPKVRFFAKYASASQWEQAEMRTEPGGSAYQFLIAGVPESLEYYVEAGGVRSPTYKLNVVDLPSVKSISVTYHYPAWTGMKDFVEDPGGDLRAVEGTTAEVAIQTDRPLANGALLLDDGRRWRCATGAGWHADGQRAHPEGRHVSHRRRRKRRGRAPQRRLFHRGAEGQSAGDEPSPGRAAISRPAPSKKSPWRWSQATISG